jgi:hypothetical protein
MKSQLTVNSCYLKIVDGGSCVTCLPETGNGKNNKNMGPNRREPEKSLGSCSSSGPFARLEPDSIDSIDTWEERQGKQWLGTVRVGLLRRWGRRGWS